MLALRAARALDHRLHLWAEDPAAREIRQQLGAAFDQIEQRSASVSLDEAVQLAVERLQRLTGQGRGGPPRE